MCQPFQSVSIATSKSPMVSRPGILHAIHMDYARQPFMITGPSCMCRPSAGHSAPMFPHPFVLEPLEKPTHRLTNLSSNLQTLLQKLHTADDCRPIPSSLDMVPILFFAFSSVMFSEFSLLKQMQGTNKSAYILLDPRVTKRFTVLRPKTAKFSALESLY